MNLFFNRKMKSKISIVFSRYRVFFCLNNYTNSRFDLLKLFVIIFLCFFFNLGFSQSNKILIYHETNGYRHIDAIDLGIKMFEDLGNENTYWITDNSQDSSVFNSTNLAQYDAVIFLNTSGDDLLTGSEQEALENFMKNGNGFIGIHSATDTYRDGSWSFYNELVGAIKQNNPNHTVNNFNADIEIKTNNSITSFLGPIGSIWNKDEEYYFWELNGGQLSSDNLVLLEVESTGSNSYDAARPITWIKESITYDDDNDSATADVTLTGIRSFYTALGHHGSDYSSNTNFITMLNNATLWAIGENTLEQVKNQLAEFRIIKNPVTDIVQIRFNNLGNCISAKVYDVSGKEIFNQKISHSELNNNLYEIDIQDYAKGIYIFSVSSEKIYNKFKVVKL